ncbi:MAG: hypothetical protein MUC45_07865 [Actinomycetia bacterium]|jgi:hypothetical protein|nr:hypothetical protein [Actinomycetes bacterium]
MKRVLESHLFGPHRVDVVENLVDEGGSYVVVVIDGAQVTDPPLTSPPTFDELVHLYARWQAGPATR